MASTTAAAPERDDKPSSTAQGGEYGFPNGHLGFLTPEQTEALNVFRKMMIDEGLVTPAKGTEPPSHNDALLLRFLRARRFVPKDAAEQFRETEKWRHTNKLDDLYMNIDVEDFDESRRYYTHSIGRRDKRGIPIYYFRIGALSSEAMASYVKSTAQVRGIGEAVTSTPNSRDQIPPRLLRLAALCDSMQEWMTKLSTSLSDRPDPQVPVTQSNNIVDITNVGLMQFWSLRNHTSDASTMATAHYPETLERIFVIGAPSFFPTIWSFVKKLFDPITTSKIFILSQKEVFPTLSEFIEPENIPKRYGGTLDFEFGDTPAIDPVYADRLTWHNDGGSTGVRTTAGETRRWPKGPLKWIVRDDGDWDLFAVGSVDGQPRRETVATLKMKGIEEGGWADESIPLPKAHQES